MLFLFSGYPVLRGPISGLFLLFLAAVLPLAAQPLAPGWRQWQTLETSHFRIHFPSGREEFARWLAPVAERAHARLEARYHSRVKKTDVVLVFDSDLVNAFAQPAYGLDQVVLYLNHPQLGSFSRFDSWAEMVFIHEYTHILTMRYYNLGDFSGLFRILLGFPWNALAPRGFVEGIAVFEESQTGKGRMRDPLTNMIARTAVLTDSFPDRGEAMSGSHRYPFGSHVYLFGGRFQGYLADQYGADRLAGFWRLDGLDNLPFDLDSRLRSLRMRHYLLEYEGFARAEQDAARQEIAAIRAAGETRYQRITQDGYSKSFLVAEADRLVYFAAPGQARPGIFELELSGQKKKRIRRTPLSAGFSRAAGEAVYSEPYFFSPGFYGYRHEIYLDGWWEKRLARKESVSYPALSPDGRQLYFIERDETERRLVQADFVKRRLGQRKVLRRVPLEGLLQYTALSPDGAYLATIERNGTTGQGQILLCETSSLECKGIVGGAALKTDPAFSADGKELYFASDADGVYNLYTYQLESGSVQRRTRTVTGFFYPAPGKEKLYALGFFRNGYDIVSIEYGDLLSEPVGFFPLEAVAPETAAAPVPYSERPYRGILTVHPWIMGILVSDVGLAGALGIGLRDALGWHMLLAGVNAASMAVGYYEYSRFNPTLQLQYATNSTGSNLGREYPGCLEEGGAYRIFCDYDFFDGQSFAVSPKPVYQETAAASLRYGKLSRTVSFQGLVGYGGERIRNARRLQTKKYSRRDLDLMGPFLTLVAGDAEYYPESISQEHGWVFFLQSQYYGPGSKTVADEYRLSDLSFFDSSRSDPPIPLGRPKNRDPLSYGVAQVGTALFLPSFADHHVNYLSYYGYTSYGPDRYTEKVSLYRFVRGLNYRKAPQNIAAQVATYEYRMPLLFASRTLGSSNTMLRSLAAGAFVDYGVSFNKYPYREDWVGSYGLTFAVGLNVLHLVLPDIKFTVARGTGPAGELQVLLSFSAGLSGEVVGNDGRKEPAYRQPYRLPVPGMENVPGYFREKAAGGVLE